MDMHKWYAWMKLVATKMCRLLVHSTTSKNLQPLCCEFAVRACCKSMMCGFDLFLTRYQEHNRYLTPTNMKRPCWLSAVRISTIGLTTIWWSQKVVMQHQPKTHFFCTWKDEISVCIIYFTDKEVMICWWWVLSNSTFNQHPSQTPSLLPLSSSPRPSFKLWTDRGERNRPWRTQPPPRRLSFYIRQSFDCRCCKHRSRTTDVLLRDDEVTCQG